MKHCLSIFILAIFCRHIATAQLTEYAERKEKVYVHTSHVYYKPGETMFFKVYVVRGENLRPSALSGIVNVDVVAPSGNVLQQLKFAVKDGYAEGSFDFATTAPGGIYRLRARTTWMQNEDESRWFVKEITLHRVVAPRVLMQLEFPEKGYGPGSEVTADFSMRNLEGKPVAMHPSEYTVSLNGQPAGNGSFSTGKDGTSKIKFRLPGSLESSAGLLNVSVKYDSYTESISRSIPIVLNKIDLQFMPEGGTMAEGLAGTMAFRAVNEFGKAADIKGVIVDSKGNRVTEFSSYHFGMGKFSFTPSRNESYEARIISPKGIAQRYPLPAALKEGMVMSVNRRADGLFIALRSTRGQRVRVAGFSRNNLLFEQMADLKPGRAAEIPVDTTLFPTGIARFTVFDPAGLPMAERVVFLQMDKTLRVSLKPDKPVYLPREKVTLKIRTENKNGLPIPANLSLSVVDDKLWTFADDKQHHILSWLLMSSELRGTVEEPNFYFREDEPKALPALDLVMLTHGYRYFEYIPEVEKESRLQYLPEQANVINGTMLNHEKKPVKGDVYLLSSRNWGRNDKVLYMETEADGKFYFSGLEPDEAYFVIARSRKKNERVNITISNKGLGSVRLPNPLPVNEASFSSDTITSSLAGTPDGGVPAAVGQKEKDLAGLLESFAKDEKRLEEVVVVALGSTQQTRTMAASAKVYTGLDLDMQANIAQQLGGRMAGLQVVEPANPGIGGRVTIRGISSFSGNNDPLWVIDGVPVSVSNFRMDPNDISSITVLKDAAATALYGCYATNGVIVIQTKRWVQKNIHLRFYRSGEYSTQMLEPFRLVYSVTKKFYSPVYASTETAVRDDFRETIYWNPVVQTNKDGEATVSFYNSDANTTFRAIAEGIGYTGAPGRAEQTYSTQQALVMDAKMPPQFTVGDQLQMLLHLKNNGSVPLELDISVTAYGALQAGHLTRIRLNAGESKQLPVPVQAMRACKETLLVEVSGDGVKERLEVPVEAADRGFPIREIFAGSTPACHRFTVSKAIPGTLNYNLRLFAGLEDQLLDGIKTLLREPHGCFEQTSATTWPNVLILRLLKQSGKNNPEAEKQAMTYIRQGYERLISFETKEQGFEWFGQTPPHLGLTAMGLMEFTDMKEFTDVDGRMMERTKNWLLSRRDGKGGFRAKEHGMGQFSGLTPPAVANCYVVYALTQAGIREEIRKEYNYALKLAIESKDAYLTGLMAIAADNMKEEADFRQLLGLLNEGKPGAGTTIVNSRYSSLDVEVMALHVLALAREKEPRLDKMMQLLEKIMKKKGYNGYGSTQGTVLALQAMTAYASRYTEALSGITASFALNGKQMQPGIFRPEEAAETQQVFTSSYNNDKGGLYYSMEVGYSTFTPPNSAYAELELRTQLQSSEVKTGETVRLDISLTNKRPALQAMAVAKIGIPAGLSLQPWQLKQLSEENKVAYYELFDNYLVFYWNGFTPGETKKLSLDLKADIPGSFTGKASTAYLYYMPEHKHWNEGLKMTVKE